MSDEAITKADMDKAVKEAVAAVKTEMAEAHEADVAGLKKKNSELVAEIRKHKEFDPAEAQRVASENDKLREENAALTKQFGALTKERDTVVKALEAESSFTSKLLIQDGIKSALIAAGVKDEDFLDALTTKFAGGAAVVIEGDARKAMIGDKAVDEAIKAWAASDAGKKFVAAPNNSGGGAPGGGGAPTGSKTVTRQQFDAMSHPERAAFSKEGGKVVDQAA